MNINAAQEGVAGALGYPLIVKGVRTRLRPLQAVTWAIITVVAATFLYSFVYWNTTQHSNTSPEAAARATIVPLMVMQGVILMGLGTGAVAGGMAKERTYRLLDYQRLTPMRPSAKIIGMLLGLPIREYFMFVVTLPFVAFAAYRGGLAFGILLQFYIVFLSSVLVYHMTGLAAGMAVAKPWRAGAFSQGMVVMLYLILPQFSQYGFTFFEYLTVRPMFLGIVQQHLMPRELSLETVRQALQTYRWESVAFFSMKIHPTLFSLLVQGFAMLCMYTVVSRKWRGETRLPFSKPFAICFFIFTQVFLVGSVIPVLHNDLLFEGLSKGVARSTEMLTNERQTGVLTLLLVTLFIAGVVSLGAVHMTTSTWHQSVHGLRRHHKRGNVGKLSWFDDAASSLPLAIALGLIACISFLAVYRAAMHAERISMGADYGNVLVALLFFLAVLIAAQQVREQGGERVFVMGIFAAWVVPLLAMVVVLSAFNRPVLAAYISLPFPAAGLYISSVMMVDDPLATSANPDMVPHSVASHLNTMFVISLLGYTAAMLALLLRGRRRWNRIERAVTDPTIKAESSVDSVPEVNSAGPAEHPPVPQPQAAS